MRSKKLTGLGILIIALSLLLFGGIQAVGETHTVTDITFLEGYLSNKTFTTTGNVSPGDTVKLDLQSDSQTVSQTIVIDVPEVTIDGMGNTVFVEGGTIHPPGMTDPPDAVFLITKGGSDNKDLKIYDLNVTNVGSTITNAFLVNPPACEGSSDITFEDIGIPSSCPGDEMMFQYGIHFTSNVCAWGFDDIDFIEVIIECCIGHNENIPAGIFFDEALNNVSNVTFENTSVQHVGINSSSIPGPGVLFANDELLSGVKFSDSTISNNTTNGLEINGPDNIKDLTLDSSEFDQNTSSGTDIISGEGEGYLNNLKVIDETSFDGNGENGFVASVGNLGSPLFDNSQANDNETAGVRIENSRDIVDAEVSSSSFNGNVEG